MISLNITDIHLFTAFWLSFSKWLAIIFQIPIFDNMNIPTIVKILSAFVISYSFFPYVSSVILSDIQLMNGGSMVLLHIVYLGTGLLVGFLLKSIMQLFAASGSLMTQQIGFSGLTYFDPNFIQRVGPFEQFLQWTVLILLLSSGAMIPMMKGAYMTFFSLQFGNIERMFNNTEYFINFFKAIFASSLLLASPIIFTNLVINCVLGFIARSVPQLNILMVSFIVNIGLGLLVFASISDEFFLTGYKIYTEYLASWFQFVS